jgi:hypothetical protein
MADDNKGFIKIWRKSYENPLYFAEPFTRFATFRGVAVKIERGQVAAGECFLGERWQWSRGKVRRFMALLVTEQQIVQQKSNVITLVTILNYNEYQSGGTANGTTDGQQTDSKRTASGQQTDTLNELQELQEQQEEGDTNICGSYQSKLEALKADQTIDNAITCILASHDSFRKIHRYHLENSLKAQPDRTRWIEAIEGMTAKFAGAEMEFPNRTLQNWLAGKNESQTSSVPYTAI